MQGYRHANQRDTLGAPLFRKEKGIAARVSPDILRVILLGVEILPNIGRVDVLITLVPPPVNHLRDGGVIRRPFEFRKTRRAANASCAWSGSRRLCWRSFGAVVEEELVVCAQGFVDDEEIELIMLDRY